MGNEIGSSQSGLQPRGNQQILVISFAMLASTLLFALGHTVGMFPLVEPKEGAAVATTALSVVAIGMLCVAFFLRSVLLKVPSKNPRQQRFTAHIVSLALMETCAILGFVLTNSTGDTSHAHVFGGLAAGAMILVWPKGTA